MKKTLFIFISLFFSFTVQANQDGERYFVTAKSGLIVRDAPNPTATKIAKIPHKLTVEVIEKSNISFQVNDDGEVIEGQWVKVDFDIFPYKQSTYTGYVFDGYLEKLNTIGPLDIKEIDLQTFNTLYKAKDKPQLKKITSQEEAEKLIGSRATWKEYDMLEEKNLASIMLDGRVQEVSPADVAFVAYYPTEDIILYSGGHSSDFSLSLRTGETLETVGNPEYFIESPNKKRRLNGSFGGQECSSYFFQEKINKYYTYLREFSWGNHRFNTFCYFKKFYWLNDEVFIFSHIDSYDENSKELYKYFKGSFVE